MIRTRIAPSPTGEDLHIGNLYTALINWAVAKKNNGQFIIRIEDTDRIRLVKGAENKILLSLKNYKLDYDEGPDIGGKYAPYRQSERLDIYHKYILELIGKNIAYYCICTKERLIALREQQIKEKKQTKYDKHCLKNQNEVSKKVGGGIPHVVRLNIIPGKKFEFNDLIHGQITINSDEVDDQVLLKSDGFPTYHLAVVVDDHLMKITHVIRAEEWISSTPKHVLLYQAFGWELPVFAHTPILRNPDRSKLSKRKNPVWASWYLEHGYLPEAVLNYLALMGWSHPEQKEIFLISEFVEKFDLSDINKVGPAFDLTKLTWMNQQYIQSQTDSELKNLIKKFFPVSDTLSGNTFDSLIPLVKTRMETLKDFENLTTIFFKEPLITPRNDKEKTILSKLLKLLKEIEKWNKNNIFSALKSILISEYIKMPVLYYICTGKEKGLPLPETLEILGKKETLSRLEKIKLNI